MPPRRDLLLRHIVVGLLAEKRRSLLAISVLSVGVAGATLATGMFVALGHQIENQQRYVGSGTIFVRALDGSLPDLRAGALGGIDVLRSARLWVDRGGSVAVSAGARRDATIVVVDVDALRIFSELPVRGRRLSEAEARWGLPVCLLGADLSRALGAPREIYLGGLPLDVVGVLEATPAADEAMETLTGARLGSSLVMAGDIPLRAGGRETLDAAVVQVSDVDDVEPVRRLLSSRLEALGTGRFELRTGAGVIAEQQTSRRLMAAMVSVFAGVVLLLGSLSVVGDRLGLVVERLPEIGVRVAMGANRRDIALQFALEAAIVATSAVVLGFVTGILLIALSHLAGLQWVSLPVWLPILVPVLAGGLSALCGWYPAHRAAAALPRSVLVLR